MDFFEQKKRQKYLIFVLLTVVFASIMVLFSDKFLKRVETPVSMLEFRYQKPEIKWEILEDPRLKELQPFEL